MIYYGFALLFVLAAIAGVDAFHQRVRLRAEIEHSTQLADALLATGRELKTMSAECTRLSCALSQSEKKLEALSEQPKQPLTLKAKSAAEVRKEMERRNAETKDEVKRDV